MHDSDSVLYWISVDDVVVGRDAGGPAVHVRGERLDPTRSFFPTMLTSSPNRIDAWRHLTTCVALEAAGVETDGGAPGVPPARLRFGSCRRRFDRLVTSARGGEVNRGR
jgi:hypothetical protein